MGFQQNTIEIDTTVVSKEVAQEMARGTTREKLKTDFAIAVTGNAGPTTDKTNKTVGVSFLLLLATMKQECLCRRI